MKKTVTIAEINAEIDIEIAQKRVEIAELQRKIVEVEAEIHNMQKNKWGVK